MKGNEGPLFDKGRYFSNLMFWYHQNCAQACLMLGTVSHSGEWCGLVFVQVEWTNREYFLVFFYASEQVHGQGNSSCR